LVSSRSDFSTEQINGIADQLEGAWKQVLGGQKPQQQLLDFVKSATQKN